MFDKTWNILVSDVRAGASCQARIAQAKAHRRPGNTFKVSRKKMNSEEIPVMSWKIP